MSKYRVEVTRMCVDYEYVEVEVFAEDDASAALAALTLAHTTADFWINSRTLVGDSGGPMVNECERIDPPTTKEPSA